MSKTTDVLIIGSGMAGLMAAFAAAEKGCQVSVLSEGMGSLSISGGCIDLLGYDNLGNRLDNPWSGFASLNPDHPYKLLGQDKVQTALDKLCALLKEQGLPLNSAKTENGDPANFLAPTIMGTLKPTWLFQDNIDPAQVDKAEKILVISIAGFRDCKPKMIVAQLKRYPAWKNRNFDILNLPTPFKEKGRSINALDLAHALDRKQGREWFLNAIKDKGKGFDLALLPPILGAKANSVIRNEAAQALGCPIIELQCIPPGVAGMRLRDALISRLHDLGVEFYENAQVTKAAVGNGACQSLISFSSGREIIHEPKAVVVATGGIIGGGVILGEGNAHEAIFHLDIPVPANVDDWTEPEIFGQHLLTSLGVKVDNALQPIDESGSVLLQNVFFAGRSLGGYDYASEKSGHGVACATGFAAGENAANLAKNAAGAEK